jgi:histone-lysine N-methyltransferase SETMAR
MSRTHCYECFKHFKLGRISVGEILTSGRTSTSTKDDDVEKILGVIRGNRHLTLQEFSDEVGIGIGSCHQIFTEEVHMGDVSAKFIPRLLTDDQKRTVLKSVRNCLPMQIIMKTFLRKS